MPTAEGPVADQGPMSNDPDKSVTPADTVRSTWLVRVLPGPIVPTPTGIDVLPRSRRTVPCQRYREWLVMGNSIRRAPARSWAAPIDKVRPPQSPFCAVGELVRVSALVIIGGPDGGNTTVNGVCVSALHVMTCVSPFREEVKSGMRNRPNRAINAIRDRRLRAIRQCATTGAYHRSMCGGV